MARDDKELYVMIGVKIIGPGGKIWFENTTNYPEQSANSYHMIESALVTTMLGLGDAAEAAEAGGPPSPKK